MIESATEFRHLGKCTVAHLQKSSYQQHIHTVDGINIKASDKVKYHGMKLSSDISWGKYMRDIYSAALWILECINSVMERK
jgi:hypothetical protein